jgi:hypothetical protein
MGWQSQTEIARMYLSSSQRRAITAIIQGGKNGRAFVTNMSSILPDVCPRYDEQDNWGKKRAFCISGPKTTTDEMWEAIKDFLRTPCARAHLNVKEFDFSCGNPMDGGVWEKRIVMDANLLPTYLQDYDGRMPEDLENILRSAHEHDDGIGGCWETIIIKHTVI